jgi:hypothetical protein
MGPNHGQRFLLGETRRALGTGLDRYPLGRDTRGGRDVAKKKVAPKVEVKLNVVDYSFGSQTYQIDTERQKVYRRFVEIETSRAATIYSNWRASNV